MTRRDLLTACAVGLPLSVRAAGKRPVLSIFSKHMAGLKYDELGKAAKDIGFAGVDLTVRAKGHVLPENAAADLPRAVEAIQAHGVAVSMITTGIVSGSDPASRMILSTAAGLKIPYWKPSYFRYSLDDVEGSVEKARQATTQLAALSKEYGIQAGFHNHSGDHVGSAVWDIRAIIQELDPKWIGYYFDPAHATIEGGLAGWRISQNLVSRRLKMVALKDFYWDKSGAQWKLKWCPMGEGMVNWTKVFADFAAIGFAGPMSLHVEYETRDEMASIAKDFAFIQKQAAAAYKSA